MHGQTNIKYAKYILCNLLQKGCLNIFVSNQILWDIYLLIYLLTHSLNYLLTYLLIYLLTYSMEQIPSWEANSFSTSQEIPRVLWNPKVPHRTHKRTPPLPILSQPDPVHTPTSLFLMIHLNIILLPTPGCHHCSLSFSFPHQNTVHASPFSSTVFDEYIFFL
jgi:hypothetical protein